VSADIKRDLIEVSRKEELNWKELSQISSIAVSTLADWEKGPEDNNHDKRGLALSVPQGLIEFICRASDEYKQGRKRKKRIKIGSFMKWLNKSKKDKMAYFNCGKSRRLITDILIANGRYKENTNKKYPVYRPRIKKFYPNAQVVLDGKKKDIEVLGEKFSLNMEILKDIHSDAITACKISDEEDGGVVKAVINEHTEKYGPPLSILYDNHSANLSSEVSQTLKEHGNIITINAFKGCPETKATLEGEFGLFERTVGDLNIEGVKKRDIAKNILTIVADVYVKMRNMVGRCSVCNRRPLDLMNYVPTKQEIDNAKRDLQRIKKRSDKLKEKAAKPPPEKEQLIEDIIKRNNLSIDDMDRFKKVMLDYDRQALEEAELDFYAYSHREGFDETKRTGQYFGGIVKNKQIDIDNKKKEELKRKRYFVDEKWRRKRQDYERYKQLKEDKEKVKRHPEIEMAKWIENTQNIRNSLGMIPKFFYDKIKECLSMLVKKANLTKRIEGLKDKIMSFNFTIDQRLILVKLVEKWIDGCRVYGVKSVTLKL
jgi:hypothetical protein